MVGHAKSLHEGFICVNFVENKRKIEFEIKDNLPSLKKRGIDLGQKVRG